MNQGRTVFSQVVDFVPRHTFRRRVRRYQGDYGVRSFTCWQQFLAMLFAQLTYRESLRDIEACLKAAPEKIYHMGFTEPFVPAGGVLATLRLRERGPREPPDGRKAASPWKAASVRFLEG